MSSTNVLLLAIVVLSCVVTIVGRRGDRRPRK
jgi:hypothetical protein